MLYDLDVEQDIDQLVAERAADPDGPISPERMERGFDVAERRMHNRDLAGSCAPTGRPCQNPA